MPSIKVPTKAKDLLYDRGVKDGLHDLFVSSLAEGLTDWVKPAREFMHEEARLIRPGRLDQDGAKRLGVLALDLSTTTLMPSMALMALIRHRLDAGQNEVEIKRDLVESVQASRILRTDARQQVDMDLALNRLMGIGKDVSGSTEMRRAHNILYSHFSSRRLDPGLMNGEVLNAAASIGLRDEAGLNATGALLSKLMMRQDGTGSLHAVSLMTQGLKGLVDPETARKIRHATGVDVRQYAPRGQFYGKGGVDGLFGYVNALAGKGIRTRKELAGIGISDPGQLALMQAMIGNTDRLRDQMIKASASAGKDEISTRFRQQLHSDEGRKLADKNWWNSFRLGKLPQDIALEQDRLADLKKRHPYLWQAYIEGVGMMEHPVRPYVHTLGILGSHITPEDNENGARRQILTRFGLDDRMRNRQLPAINFTARDRLLGTRRQSVGRFGMDLTGPSHDKPRVPNPQGPHQTLRHFDPALQRQLPARFGLAGTPRTSRLDREAGTASPPGRTREHVDVHVTVGFRQNDLVAVVNQVNARNARRQ